MNANLVLFKKNGGTKAFPLPADVTIVGRRQECDLCVPLMVVSRKHCEINHDQGILRVRDLGSRNGTFINGEKVTEAVLKPGDKLQVGPVSFGVQIDGEPAELSASDSAVLSPPADAAPEPAKLFADDKKIAADAYALDDLNDDDVVDVFDSLDETTDDNPITA